MASPTTMVGVATSAHLGRLSCAPTTRGTRRRRFAAAVRASASEAMATEKLGVRVERNPPESRLSELGVRQWPKWGCEKSKFPWTYSAKETCYLLQGKVKVYPDGAGEDFVEISAGDLVVFPKGMSCTWDVAEAVDKHYKFE
uniref:(S)-ureidoglycine aminohydrolase cupin domain-containing protein n=1 Tax=Oryza punctata TaxID=4537 RepID=A0A0E0KR41_ORYPU